MSTEAFIALALPHRADDDADFHVSVFVAPKLDTDGGWQPLSVFPVFTHWAAHLAEASFVLRDQHGEIPVEPVLGPVSPDVWDALFGPDTPVHGNAVPQWQERPWRTFDAATVHDVGKLVTLLTASAAPVAPPAPRDHPFAEDMLGALYDVKPTAVGGERLGVNDGAFSDRLDRLVAEHPFGLPREAIQDMTPGVAAMAYLHYARRFYDRPESAQPYQEEPTETPVALPPPDPEFHGRVAAAGDHPGLLRALGLVVDLHALDPSRLRESTWLAADVTVGPGRGGLAGLGPRVRVTATDDGALVTVPEGKDWVEGLLALGEQGRFAVLDVDADGTALKTEQFLRTLPRLALASDNGEPVDGAAPALRSTGFTVVRRGQAETAKSRLARQESLQEALLAGPSGRRGRLPDLRTEDVARGLRVEVYDAATDRWHSLHRRRSTAQIQGLTAPLDLGESDGFIQATAADETVGVDDPPVNVHEAVFGWEGWSLSVAPPGRRIRSGVVQHPDGTETFEETVEETPEDLEPGAAPPPHPVRFAHEIVPGTLPVLRYGREYAFRAWLVDLAGNVRPHELQPVPPARRPAPQARDGGRGTARRTPESLTTLRAESAGLARLGQIGLDLQGRAAAAVVVGHEEASPHFTEDELKTLATALGDLTGEGATTAVVDPFTAGRVSRERVVTEAFHEVLASTETVAFASPAARALEVYERLVNPAPGAALSPEEFAAALRTVTEVRPFLRWEPVAPPAVVPRHLYSEGESLRVLVVRSAVTQDPDSLEVTVTASSATSERHLVAPKVAAKQAELHGEFDRFAGDATTAGRRTALAVALRENGTFYDRDVASLETPGVRVPLEGAEAVALVHQPGTPPETLKSLPLDEGDAPAAGQYVVHGEADLELVYLPDPLARGVSVVFPDASHHPPLPLPFGIEGFTADYLVEEFGWPVVQPYRLVLHAGATPRVVVDGRELGFALPAGTVQRFRLASALSPGALDVLGIWRHLDQSLQSNSEVVASASDGYLWALTPSELVRLVHAVPRPVEAPRPVRLTSVRAAEETSAGFEGGVHLHGASTEQLTVEGSWTEHVDDVTVPRPEFPDRHAVALTTPVVAHERLAWLRPTLDPSADTDYPPDRSVRLHGARHEFGDTKHRRIDYRFRASTRFREYFPPEELVGDPDVPFDDGGSTVSHVVTVSVPSSAPPAPPQVHSVLPLFRWSTEDPVGDDPPPVGEAGGVQPAQPIAQRHVRRAGLRIYLERPWFSSGEGELLGVLYAPAGAGSSLPVTEWGQDPIWSPGSPTQTAMPESRFLSYHRARGFDADWQPGEPVTVAGIPFAGSSRVAAHVLGYLPQFSAERELWYVDVALEPGETAWPFIRLALARYQPESIPGLELSEVVRTDFVQVPPERSATVARTDERGVRVVVSGQVVTRPTAVGGPAGPLAHRQLVARLQRVDPEIPSDLGWETVVTRTLSPRYFHASMPLATWAGELVAPEPLPLRRPGPGASPWRVAIEEWEQFPGDPPDGAPRGEPVWERRLVYADEIYL